MDKNKIQEEVQKIHTDTVNAYAEEIVKHHTERIQSDKLTGIHLFLYAEAMLHSSIGFLSSLNDKFEEEQGNRQKTLEKVSEDVYNLLGNMKTEDKQSVIIQVEALLRTALGMYTTVLSNATYNTILKQESEHNAGHDSANQG